MLRHRGSEPKDFSATMPNIKPRWAEQRRLADFLQPRCSFRMSFCIEPTKSLSQELVRSVGLLAREELLVLG